MLMSRFLCLSLHKPKSSGNQTFSSVYSFSSVWIGIKHRFAEFHIHEYLYLYIYINILIPLVKSLCYLLLVGPQQNYYSRNEVNIFFFMHCGWDRTIPGILGLAGHWVRITDVRVLTASPSCPSF